MKDFIEDLLWAKANRGEFTTADLDWAKTNVEISKRESQMPPEMLETTERNKQEAAKDNT